MCHADLSPLTTEWSEVLEKMVPSFESSHTCRNFTKIQEWALQRKPEAGVDYSSTPRRDAVQ